jgi:uncharacterized protein
MREIIGLARIQHIDTQIDQFESRLGFIKKKLTDDKELKNISNSLLKLQDKYQSSKIKMDNSEIKLIDISKKINQSESDLYSGNIKNPKELQEVENEISSLKRLRSTQEDTLFQNMLDIEEISKGIERLNSEYQLTDNKINQLNQNLVIERENIQQSITVLIEERKAVEGSISDSAINLYDKLRISKKGIAVSTVTEGVCGSCGSTLTPTQIQSVKSSNSLIPCSTCGRLLFSQ